MPESPDYTGLNRNRWNRVSADYQVDHRTELEGDVCWGGSMPPESELSVLGDVEGKDVLELACGGGQSAVYLGRRGARVVAVDYSHKQLEYAAAYARNEGIDVRFIETSVEDLSMLTDGGFDIAFSAFAFGFVERVDRAFREAWRVLRPGGLFAFSWFSPAYECVELADDGRLLLTMNYFDRTPRVDTEEPWGTEVDFHRTYGDWHLALTDAGFVVTDVLEPEPLPRENVWSESHPLAKIRVIPGTTIWRARRPRRLEF